MDGCVGLCYDTAYDTAREDGLLALTMHYAAKAARKSDAEYAGPRDYYDGPPHQWTRLHHVARAGLAGRASVLAAAGADVNAIDKFGRSPLWHASLFNCLNVVVALLACPGIAVNSVPGRVGPKGPLAAASRSGHADVVTALLAFPGIDVNDGEQHDGSTALYCAANKGHTAIVNLLLACEGIHVNCATQYGDTPLAAASESGHIDVVRALLGCPGIDVNYGGGRRTPLIVTAAAGHVEVAMLLLAAPGVDVNAQAHHEDRDGRPRYWTALRFAVEERHWELAELLEEAGGEDWE